MYTNEGATVIWKAHTFYPSTAVMVFLLLMFPGEVVAGRSVVFSISERPVQKDVEEEE